MHAAEVVGGADPEHDEVRHLVFGVALHEVGERERAPPSLVQLLEEVLLERWSECGGRSILCSLGSSGVLLAMVFSCGGMTRVKTHDPSSMASLTSHLNVFMSWMMSSLEDSEV